LSRFLCSFYTSFDGKNPLLSEIECQSLISSLDTENLLSKNPIYTLLYIFYSSKEYKDILPLWQSYAKFTALTKSIGIVFIVHKLDYSKKFSQILQNFINKLDAVLWEDILQSQFSFKVNLIKKGDFHSTPFADPKNRNKLRISVGKKIYETSFCSVDLDDPVYEIELYLIPGQIILGLKLFGSNRKAIISRTPSKRLYFHSASMNPILIRSMVNLALTKHLINMNSKLYFLDPFMGGGGMLIEAGSLGYSTIGIDVGYWMCRGSRMNLKDISSHKIDSFPWSIIRASSDRIPLLDNCIDSIATDPPYGISTSLKGYLLEDLLELVLQECYRVLKYGAKMSLSIPNTVKLKYSDFNLSFKIYERVHKSLTRVIYVLEKTRPAV